jgi:ABC-type dipeptide/oligopeptide/nickel transport system permease component
MRTFALKRLGLGIAALVAVTTGLFALVYGAAGGAAHLSNPTQSLPSRYVAFVKNLFEHGTLGASALRRSAVGVDITSHLAATLELLVIALAIAALVNRVLGVARLRSQAGRPVLAALVDCFETPGVLFAAAFALYVCFAAGLLGSGGQLAPHAAANANGTGAVFLSALVKGNSAVTGPALAHLWPPALTLALSACGLLQLGSNHSAATNTAERPAVLDFARFNALRTRLVASYAAGLDAQSAPARYGSFAAALICIEVVIERAYGWNGLGAWFVSRAHAADVPEIAGMLLVISASAVTIYLAAAGVVATRARRLARG